jgi:inorganic pyrophosphatase
MKLADAEHPLQGHLEVQGIPIAIENRKGSVRKGVDSDGKPWRTVMRHPYGYIKGTQGKDGDEVDAYVGPKKDAPHAYVVHQHKADGTGHDEDKVMLGFNDEHAARKGYLKHYNDPKFLGPISKVTIERLKALIASKKKLTKISEVTVSSFLEELGRIQEAWSGP